MRFIEPLIEKDLKKKMVFLGGPRQCGKTTLAKSILDRTSGRYFSWDSDLDRQALLKRGWNDRDQLVIFDELHKYPRWKNWVKGIYDTRTAPTQILVTGSARLDVYRRGGDSLLGRYHYWRLHPFTLTELPKRVGRADAFDRLMRLGGFPEPFLGGDETEARRWRRDRLDRVLRDDVRDLEDVRNIGLLDLFVTALRQRVGSPVVLHHIAQDLGIADKTLKRWLEVLERMYLVFVVRPYTRSLTRAIQKPPKVYFYDNADVIGDEGAVFENLVATHVLKRANLLEDRDGYRYEVHYLRDKAGREVDLVLTRDGQPVELVEAKLGDTEPSPHLRYYAERLRPNIAVQVVGKPYRGWSKSNLHVVSAIDHLTPKWGVTPP